MSQEVNDSTLELFFNYNAKKHAFKKVGKRWHNNYQAGVVDDPTDIVHDPQRSKANSGYHCENEQQLKLVYSSVFQALKK